MAKPNKTATIGTSNDPLHMFPWIQMSLYLLLILACATLVYLNCLGNAFVMDDMTLIKSNLSIRQFDNIWHILLHSYRPLRTLSYVIDYHFWGLNPIGYHISNIVLHALCSVWVYVILRRLIPGVRVPLYTAILFAVHPIHTDAVTYMSGRRDVLFTFFYLAAFYFFLRYRENSKLTHAVVSFGSFVLSLLSKEMAASFPFLIFGYDFIFQFRSGYRAFTPSYFADILGCVRRVIKKYIYFYTLLLLSMLFAVFYYIFLKHSDSMAGWGKIEWWGGSIYTNFLTVAYVLIHYVKKSFFPIDLVADNYSFPIMHSMFDARVIFSVFVLGSLLCLFLIWMNKKKFVAFSIAFFFITLLPVMQIIPHHDLISEHYLYLPSIGFCFIMGLSFVKLEETFRKIPLVVFLLFVSITSIYSIRTLVRNRDWRSEFSIYLSDLSVHPDNKRVHFFLGKAYMDSFLYEKAIQEFDKATSGDQVFTEGYAYKSFIDYNRGDYEAALAEAIKVPDNQSWFFNYLNMGKIYQRLGENNIALDCFKKVAFGRYRLPALVNSFEIYQQTWDQEGADNAADTIIRVSEKYLTQIPGDSPTLRNLALCYEWKLKFAEAVQTYKRLEKSEPHLAGDIHLRIEQIRKELKDYQQANELLRNHENDTSGLLRLARVYYHIKRYPDACRCISVFVHTKSDEAEAYELLARLYEKKGELDKAIDNATKAVTLQGDDPDYHYLLGVLYAESMEFDRSLESFSKASALGMDSNTFERDFDKARKDKELYQSAMGNASRALELVRVYLDYNDLASAASILARVQQTAGSDVAVLHQIGALYEEMGDRYKGNAIKTYKHILALSSTDARANTRLGYIYWKKVYELPLALHYFSRSLALDPKQAQASEMKKVVDDLKGMYGDLFQ